jgi:hypothetical protein
MHADAEEEDAAEEGGALKELRKNCSSSGVLGRGAAQRGDGEFAGAAAGTGRGTDMLETQTQQGRTVCQDTWFKEKKINELGKLASIA